MRYFIFNIPDICNLQLRTCNFVFAEMHSSSKGHFLYLLAWNWFMQSHLNNVANNSSGTQSRWDALFMLGCDQIWYDFDFQTLMIQCTNITLHGLICNWFRAIFLHCGCFINVLKVWLTNPMYALCTSILAEMQVCQVLYRQILRCTYVTQGALV